MSKIKISTSLNIDLEFETAPFHKRFLAWLVDIVIFIFYIFVAIKTAEFIFPESVLNTNGEWMILLIALPVVFYPVVMEFTMNGQTIGKKLLHLRVINAAGGNATISQYLLRWLLRVADFIMLFMIYVIVTFQYRYMLLTSFTFLMAFTDILCIIMTTKGQRLGDMAAGTILINTKTKNILDETVFMEVADNYVVLYPEVMRLSDKDLNTVKKIHQTLLKNYDYKLAYNTTSKITTVLNIKTNQEPMPFFETLLKDYNYLSTR